SEGAERWVVEGIIAIHSVEVEDPGVERERRAHVSAAYGGDNRHETLLPRSSAAEIHAFGAQVRVNSECTGKRLAAAPSRRPSVARQLGVTTMKTAGLRLFVAILRRAFILAAINSMLFAVCGPARAQELAPAGTGVSVHKLSIDSAFSHTVKYIVTGGSTQLKALVRRVEWAENEVTVVEQLQLLKLDIVGNERRAQALRTGQLTDPYNSPGFGSQSTGVAGAGGGILAGALSYQMAGEATPEAAMQIIGMLEQFQAELDEKLKALPPQEKKVAEGPIDALRPRLVALSHAVAPAAEAKPATAERRLPKDVPAPARAGAKVEVEWKGTWYAAEVLQVSGGSSLIHYTGFDSSW